VNCTGCMYEFVYSYISKSMNIKMKCTFELSLQKSCGPFKNLIGNLESYKISLEIFR